MGQGRIQKTRTTQAEGEEAPVSHTQPIRSLHGKKITEDIDDLLDEIDAVLEHNAEEFVRSYVQKPGE